MARRCCPRRRSRRPRASWSPPPRASSARSAPRCRRRRARRTRFRRGRDPRPGPRASTVACDVTSRSPVLTAALARHLDPAQALLLETLELLEAAEQLLRFLPRHARLTARGRLGLGLGRRLLRRL